MTDRADLLDHLEAWGQLRIVERGDVKLGRTPNELPKPAVWVTGDRDGRLAECIMWSSGEAEFTLGFESDPRVQEHHDLTSPTELDVLLDRISSWLDGSGD